MNRTFRHRPSRGAALLIFIVLFLVASTALVYGIGRGAYADIVWQRTLESSKASFFALESGVEDAIYRHRSSENYSNTESFSLNDATVTATRTFVVDRFVFDLASELHDVYRKGYLELVLGDGASFSFGLQSDTGGVIMENSSGVLGNVYSNGAVIGTGGGDGNLVTGSVISAGPSGYVEGIHATGSVWAHDIVNTWAEEDAHCKSIDNSTVDGELYCDTVTATIPNPPDGPGPDDQPTSTLPVGDDVIDEWKATAAAGGVISSSDPRCASGTWTIDSSTTTGATKIECDVVVEKSSTKWTLQGPLWIEGDFSTKNGPTIAIDSSIPELEGKSIQMVVDNEANRSTSSRVMLLNSSRYEGYGDGSYVLLVSRNEDEKLGGPEVAIRSGQSAEGDVLLYAGHGEILIEQSGQFIGIAGLLLRLQNTAQVIYETGAVSLEFPSGPGGGYIIETWKEVK